jgi:hypothetical protein
VGRHARDPKGWFDRVLAFGFAYVDGHRFDSGFFRGQVVPEGASVRRTDLLAQLPVAAYADVSTWTLPRYISQEG